MNARPAAVITGGSRGIGRAVTLVLASAGFDVCIGYRTGEAAARAVAEEAASRGAGVLVYPLDVTSSDDVQRFAQAVYARWPAIELLVNNAGIVRDRPFALMSFDEWNAVIDTNLSGAYRVTRAFALGFIREKRGRIINITSIAGLAGVAGQANYCAAKAGLIGLSRALARELAPYEVPVNCIAPGYIDTEMTAALPEKKRQEATTRIPARRFGTTAEVAALAAFLATGPSFITGQVYTIDGGQIA